ncbi:head maturation protease, ClpP-related [Streptomyces sp. NPDC020490]|uniref:head maturation protease, ClpP-related n=1 Tax=Streptomyces sp. NPDC020490 TaxID=3365078 RepID=UPI0037BCA1E4
MNNLPAGFASFVARQREQAEKLRAAHGIEARSWYSIRNAASTEEAEVMLYDEIGGWYGATADQFIADLRGVTAPTLRVRINSPGGSVFEGIAIANALRSHPANVVIQVDSVAASIASVIAMAGDRVEMAPNSMLMIHDASGVCLGNSADMQEMAQLLDLISDNLADAYAAKAGGTREQWRELMRAETWYLPDAAVEAKLADEALTMPKTGQPVEGPEEEEPDMHRAWDLAAYGYAGPPKPEAPKPAPPAAREEQQPTLVISIADLLDEDAVARLRAAVAPPAEPAAPAVEDVAPVESAAETTPPDPAPVPVPEASAAEPVDAWAAMIAHLTQDEPDAWSVLVSNLTTTASSSAATEA